MAHVQTPTQEAASDRSALAARRGDAAALAAALQASRADTLATFEAYGRVLPQWQVPQRPEFNPPLWELGHIGWFQEFWLARNPERTRGVQADPDVPRGPSVRAGAEALYHSSRVAHATRWSLPLPDAAATQADLARQLQATLTLLQQGPHDDDGLYFFRLALLHEDMHHEAALYMAQGLGIPIDDPRWRPRPLPAAGAGLALTGGPWVLGAPPGRERGFAFDNELGRREVVLAPYTIDAQAVRWAEFLPFAEAGGYEQPRWWSDSGWAWRQALELTAPRFVRRTPAAGRAWQQWRHGRWSTLDPAEAACHLSWHEAQAWCRWAGRRLPTEAEWEHAALAQSDAFVWGDVWEWTASPFEPFEGFQPHPYRDYSAPWFDGRPVLRGASFMTQPRMKHVRYRNFFQAHRHDVPAGFRSCAL